MKKDKKKVNQIKHKTLFEVVNSDTFTTDFPADQQVLNCASCKSFIYTSKEEEDFQCPVCDGKKINKEATFKEGLYPKGIIPFSVSKDTAIGKLSGYAKKSIWYPNDFDIIADRERVRGLYIPCWHYKIFTRSMWKANSSIPVEVTHNEEKIKQSEQLSTTGYVELELEDLVVQSVGLKKLKYYELTELTKLIVPYDGDYVKNWEGEVFGMRKDDALFKIDDMIDKAVEEEVKQEVMGETFDNLQVNIEKSINKLGWVWIPVWLSYYQMGKKKYYFLIDGSRGKWISQEEPISSRKLTLFFLLVVIVGILIVLLFRLFIYS